MPITLERTPEQTQLEAKALIDCGLSQNAVVHRTGLHWSVVKAIRERQLFDPAVLERVKARILWKAYKLADDVLDFISIDEVKKAPLGAKMMAFGVAIDKARDMEGSNRPVFNIVNVVGNLSKDLSELKSRQQALLALKEGA